MDWLMPEQPARPTVSSAKTKAVGRLGRLGRLIRAPAKLAEGLWGSCEARKRARQPPYMPGNIANAG